MRAKRQHIPFVKDQIWQAQDGQRRVIINPIDANSVKVAFVDRRRGPEFLVTTMGQRSLREWISKMRAELLSE